MQSPIRVAVIGAARGRSFAHSAQSLPGRVELYAVCDINAEALAPWQDSDVRCYSNYEQVLNDAKVDAVCIATPLKLHASQAIAALEAGKHVLSEVTAVYTMQECWDLIAAVERTGLTYMMAENYCFARDVMMVGEMVRRGVFGELTFAEGSYIHAVPELLLYPDGELTWRGTIRHDFCNIYPTHSLGPVCQWLDINRSDRLATTATWHSNSTVTPIYLETMLGPDHPLVTDKAQWTLPDTVTTMIRTTKGVLIEHRFDCASRRPHHMNRYSLQGTHASYHSNITPNHEPLVWIADRSPTSKHGAAISWEPLYQYAEEFEHPWWRTSGDEAAKTGHGGGDYFALREFADAVIESRLPCIDVYDAVTWSSLSPLSEMSMRNNNCAVDVPDFKQGR